MSSHGLLPGHCLPTRGDSCLDHVILKLDKKFHSAAVAVLNTTVTDHSMVCLSVTASHEISTLYCKQLNVVNYEEAYKELVNNDVSCIPICNDPNFVASKLIDMVSTSILSNTTIKKIPAGKRILKPWITEGIVRCIRLRNSMQQ
jgi:hypothetical protein